MSYAEPVAKIALVVIIVAAAVVLGPLLTIWALNTLFPVLNIPYDIYTWAAALVVNGIMSGGFRTNRQKHD